MLSDPRYDQIGRYVERLPVDVALNWCEAKACACVGCVNRIGGLETRGVTKLEWQQWWLRKLAIMQGEPVETTDDRINVLLDAGYKLNAIKLARAELGLLLKDAKIYVEELEHLRKTP